MDLFLTNPTVATSLPGLFLRKLFHLMCFCSGRFWLYVYGCVIFLTLDIIYSANVQVPKNEGYSLEPLSSQGRAVFDIGHCEWETTHPWISCVLSIEGQNWRHAREAVLSIDRNAESRHYRNAELFWLLEYFCSNISGFLGEFLFLGYFGVEQISAHTANCRLVEPPCRANIR